MSNVETLRAYLERDALSHVDMLNGLRFGAEILYAEADGGLVYDPKAETFTLSVANEAALEKVLALDWNPSLMVAHQAFSLNALCAKFGLSGAMNKCWQSVWTGKRPENNLPSGVELRTLDREWLSFISEHYHMNPDPEYIMERLEDGVVVGAFVNGECAGFVGVHDEGSMGMLEVLPEYRRHGLALILARENIARRLDAGAIPYGHVIDGNGPSMELQHRLGMEIAAQPLYWLRAGSAC